MTLLLNSILFI